jgi:hypothetical protein
MPKETMMTGKYHAKFLTEMGGTGIITDTAAGLGVLVKITDPGNKILMEKVYGSRGKFAFTTHKPGNHKMCLRKIHKFEYKNKIIVESYIFLVGFCLLVFLL